MTNAVLVRPIEEMKTKSPIRFGTAVLGLLAGASCLIAQSAIPKPSAAVSTLPSAQPTAGGNQLVAPPAAREVTSAQVSAHVEVKYSDGKLAVQATNASLNEILREVGLKTGMKITGGVTDDRVFGSYGPSSPAVVLDALLEGTGSNMLLVDNPQGPSELILTPRRGGVTPPSPNAERASEAEDTGGTPYVAPVRAYQAPVLNGRGPGAAGADPNVIPASSDQVESSAPKTPQQIYEQLQRTMQQKQNNSPPQ